MPRAVFSFTNNTVDKEYNQSYFENNQSYFENNQSYFENNTILPILKSYRYEVRKKLLLSADYEIQPPDRFVQYEQY